MNLQPVFHDLCAPGIPRVSGDEPKLDLVKFADCLYSPRERG